MTKSEYRVHNYGVYDYYRRSLKDAMIIISEKGFCVKTAMDNYCTSEYGIKASRGVIKYMIDGSLTVALHGCGEWVQTDTPLWEDVISWVTELVIDFVALGVPTYELIKHVKPSTLIEKYHPFHELTRQACIRRVSEVYGFVVPHNYEDCFNRQYSPLRFLLGGED